MSHRDEYRQWPFLSEDEFELACAFLDRRYVRANLGPTRKVFKLRLRRTATTGESYIEILRLLRLPENDDELSLALQKLCGEEESASLSGPDVAMADEEADEVREPFPFSCP